MLVTSNMVLEVNNKKFELNNERSELRRNSARAAQWSFIIFTLGLAICLVGALLMIWGDAILGENHTGIATIVGIIGIGIIGISASIIASTTALRGEKR